MQARLTWVNDRSLKPGPIGLIVARLVAWSMSLFPSTLLCLGTYCIVTRQLLEARYNIAL